MNDKFEHISASELFAAAVRKAFEKKRTRVITSLVLLMAAMFCVRKLHNDGWYMIDDPWLDWSITVLLFAVVLISGGVLMSSVGSFKRWKYFVGASAAAVLTCGTVTVLGVFTTLLACEGRELPYYFSIVLRNTVPMTLTALCPALLTGAFVTREKTDKA